MTEEIKEQIETIRKTGDANMLDVNTVQRVAFREGCYDLVVYLEEHPEEYVKYLLTGKTPEEES